jgi:hypothetical protein
MSPATRQLVELLARAVARELAADAPDPEKGARLRDSGAGGQGETDGYELEHQRPTTNFANFNSR